MCGIFGVVGSDISKDQGLDIVKRAIEPIAYRGPDAEGYFADTGFALAHRRLALIDLQTGAQPMSTPDGKLHCVYNGEIYNYIELRAELSQLGYRFNTTSDTEVLLAAYSLWGPDFVKRLNGMFAFAIVNQSQGSVFCARDPYGQKPLYYYQKDKRLYFASELKCIRVLPEFDSTVSPERAAHFLAFEGFMGDQCIYSDAKRVRPGQTLEWDPQHGLRLNSYFKNVPSPNSVVHSQKNPATLESQVDASLLKAVQLTWRADVPVAALLSGGLDSSLVLGLARALYSEQNIEAFHIRNHSQSLDEFPYAKAVADHLQVKLNVCDLDSTRLCELAATVPGQLDEPQADPGLLPKFEVCRSIQSHFKAALTGDGGDEFFLGYLLFRGERLAAWYERVPTWVHRTMIQPLCGLLPPTFGYMSLDFISKQFLKGFPAPEHLRALHWIRSWDESKIRQILPNAKLSNDEAEKLFYELYQESINCHRLDKLAYRMQRTYLTDYVLPSSDRGSMLNSIELRAPFLDLPLAQLMNSINAETKMAGMELKSLLKRVALKYLPRDVVYRKKVGFTVPIAELWRTKTGSTLLRDTFSDDAIKKTGMFQPLPIQQMIERHLSGKENLYKPLWTLFCLQSWLLENGKSRN